MLFSSITFLYFFLPLTIFLYFLVPQKGRNVVLFMMSILFYAWGEPVYALLMLMQIMISFILIWLMECFRGRRAAGVFYILSVLLPFAALFYFKYFGFFMENVFGVKAKTPTLPIGISFYTFQIVSYCIDVHRGKVKRQKNIITYASYVTLFPQLVAGPIVRYSEIEQTLTEGAEISGIRATFKRGFSRFAVGLGKKVLIANVIGEFVTEVTVLGQRSLALSWAYAAAVSLQIYFDFSGYSDMAIGLGGILGFQFPENFRYPFTARSIRKFWQRWHITLGAWFRDYIYIPMGGNRVSLGRWMFNIVVVWLLTGLWHGAGWNFILWGLLFAVFLVFEKGISILCGGKVKAVPGSFGSILAHLYVLLVVMISFLIFHNDSLSGALADIQALVHRGSLAARGADASQLAVYGYLLRNRVVILGIGLAGSTPLPMWFWEKVRGWLKRFRYGNAAVGILRGGMTIALLILCTAYLIDGSFNPFLYFRF